MRVLQLLLKLLTVTFIPYANTKNILEHVIIPRQIEKSILLFPTNEKESNELISSFNSQHSSGYDFLSISVLQVAAPLTASKLFNTIHKSFQEGIIHDEIRKAKVKFQHKNGSGTLETNYRQISVLILWSKIFD